MKRIYNSDIRISTDGMNLPDSYTFKFYTVEESVCITRTENDVDGEGYINLDWSMLQLLGEGGMSYTLTKHIADSSYPDGYYDTTITRATNYYIVTDVVPIPSGDSASTMEVIIRLIEDFEENVAEALSAETVSRMEADGELQDEIDVLSGRVDALEEVDLSVYATKVQLESGVTDAKNYATARDAIVLATAKLYSDTNITDMATRTWVQGQGYLTEHQSLESYVTKSDYNRDQADMASKNWVQGYNATQNYVNQSAMQSYVDERTSAITVDLSDYYTSAQTQQYVQHAIEGGVDLSNYYKKSETYSKAEVDEKLTGITVDLSDYYTSAQTDNAIDAATNDMATQTWVGEQGYLTEHQDLSEYAKTEDVESALTEVNTAIDGKQDAGDYALRSEIPTVPTNVSAFNNDAGYLTEHQDLTDYAKTEDVISADTATSGATIDWVKSQGYLTEHQDISGKANTSDVESALTSINTAIDGKQDAGDYALKSDVTSADTAVSGATIDWVKSQSYLTEHQDISGKADITDVNSALTSIDTAIAGKQNAGNYVSASTLDDYYTSAATDTLLASKADITDIPDVSGYIDGAVYSSATKQIIFYHGSTEITTIDATDFIKDGMVSNVKIENGNLVITFNADSGKEDISIPLTSIFDPSNYYTSAQTDNAITIASGATVDWVKAQNFLTTHQDLTGYALKTDVTSADTATSGATIDWVKSQSYLTEHQDLSEYAKTEDVESALTEVNTAISGKQDKGNYVSASTLDDYYTSAETDTAISTATNGMATETWVQGQGYLTEHQDISGKADTSDVESALTSVDTAIAGKQDALVSGTNIKTINNQSILGEGNITIEGGGDLSNYYTSAQTQEYVQGELADYYTSGETQAYVQEQLSGISGGGVSEERFEGLEEATANALYQHELTLIEHDSRFDNYITAEAVDAKLANKASTYSVNALSNKVDSIETATAAALNDLHEQISGGTGGGVDLSNYYTSAQTDTLLSGKANIGDIPSLEGYATEAYVQEQISGISIDLSDYYTSAQTNNAISTATSDMATQTWVQEQGYLTEHQSLAGYVTTAMTVNSATTATSAETANSATTATSATTANSVPSGVTGYDQAYTIRVMTQAAYDLITPDVNTIYIIQG